MRLVSAGLAPVLPSGPFAIRRNATRVVEPVHRRKQHLTVVQMVLPQRDEDRIFGAVRLGRVLRAPRLSSAARFALQSCENEASTSATSSRWRLDAAADAPLSSGDPDAGSEG